MVLEEFKVPIMVKSDIDADFELRLENRTGRSVWINFTYSKSTTYTELIRYEGKTSDDWVLVPVEVTNRLRIRGIGDWDIVKGEKGVKGMKAINEGDK